MTLTATDGSMPKGQVAVRGRDRARGGRCPSRFVPGLTGWTADSPKRPMELEWD